ncbi:DUF4403 family protein [Ochrobactrum sp. Kaboul]|nr:DUF4403 family protein [Ochrobactrum sp. Kaboul]
MSSPDLARAGRSRTRMFVIGLSMIVFATLLVLIIEYLRIRNVELSEAPERRATGLVLEPSISEFSANLTLPYGTLSRLVTDTVRAGLRPTSGRERIGCAEVRYLFKQCLDFNWTANPSIPSPVTFQSDNDRVRINFSGAIDGGGGFGGGIASILSLNRKNFDAAFAASVATKIAFDADFCPVLTPGEVQFGWTKEARIELIGRSSLPFGLSIGPYNLDFGRHFNGPIRNMLKEAVSGAKIDCSKIRTALEALWRRFAIPVALENAPPIFINIDPVAIYLSGIQGIQGGIRTSVAVQARVVVETQKGREDSKSEPLRNTSPVADSTALDLAVPVKIPYEILKMQILEAVAREPIKFALGNQSASVTIKAVDVYPAGDRVALGVWFKADLPWRIFSATGTVWITAKPVAEENGTVIRLDDLNVTRRTDSALWNTLTAGFAGILLDQFGEKARYDLAGTFVEAMDKLQEALTNSAATNGVRITLSDPKFYVGRMVAEDEQLAVEAGFRTSMEADLSELTVGAD